MITKKFSTIYFLFLLLFCFQFNIGLAQSGSTPRSIFDYITAEEGAAITLETDLTNMLANRNSEDYQPGVISLSNGKTFQVKLMPKGRYRRKVAEVPPLKIKFPKKMLAAEGLDTLNEIKLVLPIYDNNLGDELIVKEYLAYRMFEHLTQACIRARLVKVTLRDNHVEASSKKMYGLLVEDNEETAARLNGMEVERFGLPIDSLIVNQAALVTAFEYMIGNTDWDISMIRNVRLIQSKESGKIVLVPYDFDFAGIVSAPYASPDSESGLLTVRDRFMKSNGIPKESLRRAIQTLRGAQREFYKICRSRHLSRTASENMVLYLDTFFQAIDDNNDVPVRMNFYLSE